MRSGKMKDKIEKVLNIIKENKNIAEDFKTNPTKVIESIVGKDLPDDVINAIINGVKARLTADKASDFLGGIKKLF
jgi:hypothetical protein